MCLGKGRGQAKSSLTQVGDLMQAEEMRRIRLENGQGDEPILTCEDGLESPDKAWGVVL